MPFLGKSGTSRISFFRGSQLMLVLMGATLVGITRLLRCEKLSDRKQVWLQILQHCPPGRRVGLRADANAVRPVDRGYPWPALRHCCQHCCAPILQSREDELHVLRTSESRHPEPVREPESGVL